MGEILERAERAWQGELGGIRIHPNSVNVGIEEMQPGIDFISAFSNAAVVETGEGLVFLDTSGPFHAGKIFELVRGRTPSRVHSAVYTHGHVDHVFGLGPFEQEAREKGWETTRVIAHEACPERFDRYRLTNGYNGIINQRQFDLPKPLFPQDFRYPDVTMRDEMTLNVGGIEIELHHDRGETDDHVWAWLPEQRTLYTGDLFIWASPNCGNPQKVQRYPREWAMALRKMQKLAPQTLLPGHGPPIMGAARVRQALSESAELIENLVEQTLAMMNEGARLNDLIHAIELPERLLERPYLRPVYDDPIFIVRNLWRLYGGWYDGNPAHLKPAPDPELARSLASLSGGARALARRAEELAASEQLDVACHLIEFATQADPDDREIHGIRVALYRARGRQETSLMSRAIYEAAARDSEPE
jgi:alkyl sulfatase BDS1-like metallo-beta-lactamase superfamily hydrolase